MINPILDKSSDKSIYFNWMQAYVLIALCVMTAAHSNPTCNSSFEIPQNFITKNHSRIFFLGDSLIGQIFRQVMFKTRREQIVMPKRNTHFNNARGWNLYKKYKILYSDAYHMAIFHMNYTMLTEEIDALMPQSNDVIIMLFGAHYYSKPKFEYFVEGICSTLVYSFPGKIFWIEPLPQHFETGVYSYRNSTCFPINENRNNSQFWRVETVRQIFKPTRFKQIVPVYETAAPLWYCHPEPKRGEFADCTHYFYPVYQHIVLKLLEVDAAMGSLCGGADGSC